MMMMMMLLELFRKIYFYFIYVTSFTHSMVDVVCLHGIYSGFTF